MTMNAAEINRLNKEYTLFEWSAQANYQPIAVARAKGSEFWDADGKRYLDFMSAYSAVSHGHAHPRLVAALVDQAHRVAVTSRAYYSTELAPFLAKLVEVADLDGPARALPASGGCESVETAIKAARSPAASRAAW